MRLWPLMASIGYRKLHFICSLHNGRLLVFVANFCIVRQNTFIGPCMPRIAGTSYTIFEFSTSNGWGVRVGVSGFGSMWSIRQVIRSLRNFHWKVFSRSMLCASGCLSSYPLHIHIQYRLSTGTISLKFRFDSFITTEVYIHIHFLCCLKGSLSHLFCDFAIIMSLLIGYFIVIVW